MVPKVRALDVCNMKHSSLNPSGADLGLDAGRHKAALELAGSENGGTTGWAMNSGYVGHLGRFVATGAASWIADSFSVEDIG